MHDMVSNALCRAYQKGFYIGSFLFDWREPELITGPGAVKKLPQRLKSDGIMSVLIVTDAGLMKLSMLDGLFAALDAIGVKYCLYDETKPNPTIGNIEDALALYKKNNCGGIVAFGGGSPMDCAKGVGARLARPNKTIPQMRGYLKVLKKLPPLYAVPTTAGTGSEGTIAAVVTNPDTHEKFAVADPKLRPKCAVLDAELTMSLPKHITSSTGMDALTHAVEAYIGKSNTKDTKANAVKATKLVFGNLEKAYNDGDIVSRENMLMASYYGGLAFTRAYVGYVHAIAHNLGGLYGVPHGLANAVILPEVIEYFGESAHKKLGELADAAGLDTAGKTDAQKANLFIAAVRGMNARMGIPTGFDVIKEEDIALIAQRAAKEGNPAYPVPKILRAPQLSEIIRKVMLKG